MSQVRPAGQWIARLTWASALVLCWYSAVTDRSGTRDPTIRWAELLVEILLVVAASILMNAGIERAATALSVAAVTAVLGTWSTSFGVSPTWRSVGLMATGVTVPLVILAVVVTADRQRSTSRRTPLVGLAISATFLAILASVTRGLVYDPFRDVSCRVVCSPNTLLIDSSMDAAESALVVWRMATVAACCLAVIVVFVVRTTWTFRFGACVAAILMAAGALLAVTNGQGPERAEPAAVWSSLVGMVVAAVAMSAIGMDRCVRLRRVRRLATLAVDGGVDDLQSALADALDDPSLRLAFTDDADTLVIEHDNRIDPLDLERRLGAAARLAAWNDSLSLEGAQLLHSLRTSRRGVVESMYEERRRIERDLHDGVQQQLLAVAHDLRRARMVCDVDQVSALDRSISEVRAALAEFRGIATSIYPVLAAEGGLELGSHSLTDSAARPVVFSVAGIGDPGVAPVLALYDVADTAINCSAEGELVIECSRDAVGLHLHASGPLTAIPPSLVDQIEALGGRCTTTTGATTTGATTTTRWEVTVPCES